MSVVALILEVEVEIAVHLGGAFHLALGVHEVVFDVGEGSVVVLPVLEVVLDRVIHVSTFRAAAKLALVCSTLIGIGFKLVLKPADLA